MPAGFSMVTLSNFLVTGHQSPRGCGSTGVVSVEAIRFCRKTEPRPFDRFFEKNYRDGSGVFDEKDTGVW